MPAKGRHHFRAATHTTHEHVSPGLERLILLVGIVEPLMTLPQIIEIWSHKNAQGVSLTTWALYVAASAAWSVYGFKIKNKPLMITGLLWVAMEGAVIVGVLIWR